MSDTIILIIMIFVLSLAVLINNFFIDENDD